MCIDDGYSKEVSAQFDTQSLVIRNEDNPVTIIEAEGVTVQNYPLQIARPFLEGEIQEEAKVSECESLREEEASDEDQPRGARRWP